MIIQDLIIKNKTGLHARPAATWAQTAGKFKSSIRLRKGDKEIDGKSLLSILSLGLSAGSDVQLIVDGPDAQAAVDALTSLLEQYKEA